jgi:hypothetical protein
MILPETSTWKIINAYKEGKIITAKWTEYHKRQITSLRELIIYLNDLYVQHWFIGDVEVTNE